MAQGILPFQYEVDKKPRGMTALAGLPLYLDLAHVMGLRRLISEHVRARQGDQGWTDDQIVMALVLLNLAGGTCVEDIRVLEGDEGFCRVFREVEFAARTRSKNERSRGAGARSTLGRYPRSLRCESTWSCFITKTRNSTGNPTRRSFPSLRRSSGPWCCSTEPLPRP